MLSVNIISLEKNILCSNIIMSNDNNNINDNNYNDCKNIDKNNSINNNANNEENNNDVIYGETFQSLFISINDLSDGDEPRMECNKILKKKKAMINKNYNKIDENFNFPTENTEK